MSQLNARALKQHAVNLNFDMVGSPNFVRFVYDGDGSAFGATGPNGSARVEQVFLDYFASQGLATEPTEFDGRSDYFAFINNGIPAGGLFTGAEGIKTAEEAAIYGGTAGVAYDPCYHQACDDIDNLSDHGARPDVRRHRPHHADVRHDDIGDQRHRQGRQRKHHRLRAEGQPAPSSNSPRDPRHPHHQPSTPMMRMASAWRAASAGDRVGPSSTMKATPSWSASSWRAHVAAMPV